MEIKELRAMIKSLNDKTPKMLKIGNKEIINFGISKKDIKSRDCAIPLMNKNGVWKLVSSSYFKSDPYGRRLPSDSRSIFITPSMAINIIKNNN